MNWNVGQPDHDPEPLDRLLRQARWAEPSPETIGRLQADWKDITARRLRRRRRALAALAGAAIAVTSVVVCMRSQHGADQAGPTPIAVSPSPRAGEGVGRQANSLPIKSNLTVKRSAAVRTSRPPNPYERLVLVAYRRARLASELREQSAASETPTQEPAQADAEAVQDTAHGADSATLAPTASEAQSPQTQKELLAMLLSRGDRRSVEVFLERVEDPETSSAAFDCLESMSNPPVEILLRFLHSPVEGQRLAAARVLGRLNQAAVSRELIAMVVRGVRRQEAMVALLSSSETTAQEFLAGAARNPVLSVALWNAKRQFQTPFPRRS